ncbi:MAG TPA: hypothetical protein VMF65_11185 [Acidimicrobiales bacterium]|nr:hypothetical protein [Acidimicrobiales bacterium]
MHYCQSCDDPVLMEPYGAVARCPRCGQLDETGARMPLFIVTGASGAGKTSVFGPLARLLAGTALAFDVDVLLDSAGMLSGDRPISWPGFRDAWLSVAHGIAQNGLPTVLLGPFIPEHLEQLPARRWVGELNFLVLDCSDELRHQRVAARPPWRDGDFGPQDDFARWLRENIAYRVDTGLGTPADTAREVFTWVTGSLGRGRR